MRVRPTRALAASRRDLVPALRGYRFQGKRCDERPAREMEMTAYRHLLSPITIKGRTFRNRVFSSSHAPGYAEAGLPGERYQAYHEEKARGGIGLTMFGGSSNVSRDSGSIYGQIYVGDDRVISAFRSLARRVHAHGAGLMCQISHM